MDEDVITIDGLTHQNIKWAITQETRGSGQKSVWPIPVCITCQTPLKVEEAITLFCQNPSCVKFNKKIQLTDNLNATQTLVLRLYEGISLRKQNIKWKNIDQQLVEVVEAEANEDDKLWALAKFYDTPQGKMLMVLLGEKGKNDKAQIFIKDGLDLVSADLVGDMNPKDILLGFTAYFSDGAVSTTEFNDKK